MAASESNRGERDAAEPDDRAGEADTQIEYACPSCGHRLEHYAHKCPGCSVDLESLYSGTYRMPATKVVRTIALVALVGLGTLILLALIATIAQWLTGPQGGS